MKLSGRVVFRGSPPARRVINMSKDAKCVELHGDKPVLDEDLIVSDGGGVKNAFVCVRRGAPKMRLSDAREARRAQSAGLHVSAARPGSARRPAAAGW